MQDETVPLPTTQAIPAGGCRWGRARACNVTPSATTVCPALAPSIAARPQIMGVAEPVDDLPRPRRPTGGRPRTSKANGLTFPSRWARSPALEPQRDRVSQRRRGSQSRAARGRELHAPVATDQRTPPQGGGATRSRPPGDLRFFIQRGAIRPAARAPAAKSGCRLNRLPVPGLPTTSPRAPTSEPARPSARRGRPDAHSVASSGSDSAPPKSAPDRSARSTVRSSSAATDPAAIPSSDASALLGPVGVGGGHPRPQVGRAVDLVPLLAEPRAARPRPAACASAAARASAPAAGGPPRRSAEAGVGRVVGVVRRQEPRRVRGARRRGSRGSRRARRPSRSISRTWYSGPVPGLGPPSAALAKLVQEGDEAVESVGVEPEEHDGGDGVDAARAKASARLNRPSLKA